MWGRGAIGAATAIAVVAVVFFVPLSLVVIAGIGLAATATWAYSPD